MDIKTISVAFVAIMVGAVAFGAMLPIFQDVTATEDTYTNDGYYRMSKITSTDDDVTIKWDYTKPYIFVVNGVDCELPFGSTTGAIFPYTIMCSDTWGIRATIYNSGVTLDMVLFGNASGLIWYSSTTDGYNVTFTFSSGTFTAGRDGGSSTTQSYTTAYYLDKNGPLTMKKGTVSAYLNDDSPIFSTGRTSTIVSGVNMNINVQATIDDGATVSMIYPDTGYTVTNESVNATPVNGHINLYSFDNVTFDISGEGGSGTATYGQVIVPYQVTAERTVQGSDGFNTIVNLIPLVIGMGLLLIAVWWFVVRKF